MSTHWSRILLAFLEIDTSCKGDRACDDGAGDDGGIHTVAWVTIVVVALVIHVCAVVDGECQ